MQWARIQINARSIAEVALRRYNEMSPNSDPNRWDAADAILRVGTGTQTQRNDALRVMKSGVTHIKELEAIVLKADGTDVKKSLERLSAELADSIASHHVDQHANRAPSVVGWKESVSRAGSPTLIPSANGVDSLSSVHGPSVCSNCSAAPRSGEEKSACKKKTHFFPWRMPRNLAYARYLPCAPPHELTHDNVFLPVTHFGGPRRGPTASGGLWFYYARGCSDLLWNSGRSMLARNRVHAAVMVEQRLALAWQGQYISDREAIRRVANYSYGSFPQSMLRSARVWMGADASFDEMLTEVARGLYGVCGPKSEQYADDGVTLNPCQCRGGLHGWWNTTELQRLTSLGSLASDASLDKHIATRVRRLPLDTISLYQQPQGAWMWWTTEIWDLRGDPVLSRHLENTKLHPEVVGHSLWARAGVGNTSIGFACEPAASWQTCMSCRGSSLEPHCNSTAATILENYQF